MNFTALFAILGAVFGAVMYVVANIRLGTILMLIIAWQVYDHWSDGPPRREATRYQQEVTRQLKKQVEFTNIRVEGEPNRPTVLTFHVTNPLKARLSDLSAICTVSRQNGNGTTLRFKGTTSIGPQSSASVSLENVDFTYYSTARELWLDLSTVACDPEFNVNEVDLIKAGHIKPSGAEQEIASLSDIRVSGEFRYGADYNKYDKQRGRVIATATIHNRSRFILTGAWVGCSVEGADRQSSGRTSFYIAPGDTHTFSLKLSEVQLHGLIDRPKGRVYDCKVTDFSHE